MQIRLMYPHVFCASIALPKPGLAQAIRVVMEAAHTAADIDPWASTQHHVFKRLSALGMRAHAYFTRRAALCMLLGTQQAGAGMQAQAGAAAPTPGGSAPGAAAPAAAAGAASGTPQQQGALLPDGLTPAGPATGAAAATSAGHHGGSSSQAPCGPSPGVVALEDLLLWLASYRDLFSRPCCVSGRLMALEAASQVPLPPVFRPFM